MSLLSSHLEQISISCQGIDGLPFPAPKIFTNALLSNHDITSLIRDTEAHERALFSVPPPPPSQLHNRATSPSEPGGSGNKRRHTVFNVAAGEVTTGPPPGSRGVGGGAGLGAGASSRRNTAVAAVLGGDLHSQIVRRGGAGAGGDVDIEVLLHGAEKLCHVYPLPGALERIPALRQRHVHQSNTLAYYEARVADQGHKLERMNKDHFATDDDEDDDSQGGPEASADDGLTEEDLRREEEEVRELDKKKKELQERLRAMDEDLGGLLNI